MVEIRRTVADMLLSQLAQSPQWMQEGSCQDSELDPFWEPDQAQFQQMCSECPVREACRQHFSEREENIQYGVFGGINYGEVE